MRPFAAKAVSYAIASLPIALWTWGLTLIENIRYPRTPAETHMDWDMRSSAGEVFVLTYLIAIIYALPGYALLRWAAARYQRETYAVAILAGGLIGATLPLIGVMENGLAREGLPQIALVFITAGMISGGIYFWLERRLTDISHPQTQTG